MFLFACGEENAASFDLAPSSDAFTAAAPDMLQRRDIAETDTARASDMVATSDLAEPIADMITQRDFTPPNDLEPSSSCGACGADGVCLERKSGLQIFRCGRVDRYHDGAQFCASVVLPNAYYGTDWRNNAPICPADKLVAGLVIGFDDNHLTTLYVVAD